MLTLFLVWAIIHHCIKEIIRLALAICQVPDCSKGVTNLCVNIYRCCNSLSNCKSDRHVSQCSQGLIIIWEQSMFWNIQPHTLWSYPSESVLENMGSVLEKIHEVRGGSKTSTNKKNSKHMSDELIIHWNGLKISKYGSVVMQALNLHFKSGPWHLTSSNVQSQMHKVSIKVDRINCLKPALIFMPDVSLETTDGKASLVSSVQVFHSA